jgi:hypothetical protein
MDKALLERVVLILVAMVALVVADHSVLMVLRLQVLQQDLLRVAHSAVVAVALKFIMKTDLALVVQ